jgi:hypothetical protein
MDYGPPHMLPCREKCTPKEPEKDLICSLPDLLDFIDVVAVCAFHSELLGAVMNMTGIARVISSFFKWTVSWCLMFHIILMERTLLTHG